MSGSCLPKRMVILEISPRGIVKLFVSQWVYGSKTNSMSRDWLIFIQPLLVLQRGMGNFPLV